jgi:hypothetical protein
MSEGAVASAKSAAKSVGYEALDVVIEYILPLGFGVGGFISGANLIGGVTLGNAIWDAGVKAGPTATRIAGAVLGGVTGGIGLAFWRLGNREGMIVKIIGKSVGAFFIGTALNYVAYNVVMGNAINSGGLDTLFGSVQQVAGGA